MTTTSPTPFGDRLRRSREAAGLSQEALADKTGLSVKGISALERGARQRPHPRTVALLAGALDISALERALWQADLPPRPRPAEDTPARGGLAPLPVPLTPLIGRDEV